MLALPAIVLSAGRLSLPLSDHSASLLIDVLLCDDQAACVPQLTEGLAGDPSLVTWAVWQMQASQVARPRSLGDVAQWLSSAAASLLRWPDESPMLESSPWQSWIMGALETADLAALIAAEQGEAIADEAFLLGLLAKHELWPTDALGAVGKSDLAWRGELAEQPAWRHVEAALGNSDGDAADQKSAPSEEEALESLARAEEQAEYWTEAVDGVAGRLLRLSGKLTRLAELEESFQQTLEHEKLESLAELAAGAGHDINNPLAIIGGRSQLLLRGEQDAERRRDLAVIAAQVKRAYEMIADLRLFARPAKPEPEQVDLVALVDELVAKMSESMTAGGVTIERTGDDGPLEIEADPAQLSVALMAMCRNSREAIPHQGHVAIDLRAADEGVEIQISDDGTGITPEQRRHLFDPFYSARQAGRGLGFGLSKCWSIVRNHGGSIEVESEPEQGATFTIRLPREFGG